MDVASIKLCHSIVDQNGMFSKVVDDSLNQRLTLEANVDQSGRAFIQDVVSTMLSEGHVAIVPTASDIDPVDGYINEIYSWRTGIVKEWYPNRVRVDVYNELIGERAEIVIPKAQVAIVQNPLYSIMNEPNSTLQRLLRKMSLLDYADEVNTSGRLDVIVQLPYTIKTEARKKEAEKRRKQIEDQLNGAKYGIAYIDGTEKITQLNRSLENNLENQIKDLQNTLYGQLGISEAVFLGTAGETEMINYYNRTIEPILSAIIDEMKRKFITQNSRTRGYSISFFRDPFALADSNKLGDIADKFTRNAILSSNEVRVRIGYMPCPDERADALSNKNLNEQVDGPPPPNTKIPGSGYGGEDYQSYDQNYAYDE